MIVPWLFHALPGPAWLRAALLLLLAAAMAWFLWNWGFPWLMQHLGPALNGNPTVGQNGA
ncbi:hypothetical protein [Streptacidiphilus sp. EB129]|uniref:hypothetical protein n=1 Tax=Streptacidiphilus sp. EB129 TaxID=3156262 RepID=UPI003516D710